MYFDHKAYGERIKPLRTGESSLKNSLLKR